MEWLVGEGRQTCPLCRAHQTEHDDWILQGVCEEPFDETELKSRLSGLYISILRFLDSLPTLKEYVSTYGILYSDLAQCMNDQQVVKGHDGLGAWISSELSYLSDIKLEEMWSRCKHCTCRIRIPKESLPDMVVCCQSCSTIQCVEELYQNM